MGSDMELCFNVRTFFSTVYPFRSFLIPLGGLVLRPLPFDFPRSTMQTERLNVALIKALECADKSCILPK